MTDLTDGLTCTPTQPTNGPQVQVDDSSEAASNIAGVQVREGEREKNRGGTQGKMKNDRQRGHRPDGAIDGGVWCQAHTYSLTTRIRIHPQDLAAGDVHVLKYRVVRPLVLNEDVELI